MSSAQPARPACPVTAHALLLRSARERPPAAARNAALLSVHGQFAPPETGYAYCPEADADRGTARLPGLAVVAR